MGIRLFVIVFVDGYCHGRRRMEFLSDLWGYMKVRKTFWLLPTVLILLVFMGLIILSSGSALAPFIYSLF